jgi:hypothetical protein
MTEAQKWKLVAEVLASRLSVHQRKEKELVIKEALAYVAKYEKSMKKKA